MHIVTGAAGFIGSNMVKHLNKNGHTDIICVDIMNNHKVANLHGLEFQDFISPDELLQRDLYYDTVWHLGANSKTSSNDWDSIYESNVVYTRRILDSCKDVVFASSASIYGDNKDTKEIPVNEAPKNMYAATKMMCDNMISKYIDTHRIQSWRFFNVYGNRERHKVEAGMASPYSNFKHQANTTGVIKLFDNSKEVFRDFICVDDVVNIMYNTHSTNDDSFICNLGTGNPVSFQHWGELMAELHGATIEYITVPEELKNIYQMYTCSDNTNLHYIIGDYNFIKPQQFAGANL